jgi:hypothetical protein
MSVIIFPADLIHRILWDFARGCEKKSCPACSHTLFTVTTHSCGCPGSVKQEGEERVLHNTQERGRPARQYFLF